MSRIMMQLGGAVRPLTFGARGDGAPLLASADTPWSGLQFEVHRMRSSAEVGESGPLDGELGLMVVTRGSYEIAVRARCGDVTARSSRGMVHLLSGDERPHVLAVRGDAEVVAFRLAPEWLAELPVPARALRHRGPLEGGRTVQALVSAVCEEVASGCGAGRLYAESLSLSLLSYVAHLLPAAVRDEDVAGLSSAERERIRQYVHDNLDRDLSISALSALVGASPRRFSERFRASFGMTPHGYVTQARLREGARLLESGRYEIAEIALRVGFCSQSHFTSAFRRAFGETPRRYARARRSLVPT